MPTSTLLPIGQAAQYLGLSAATLRRWHKSGKTQATFVSPGGRLYYAMSDLQLLTKGLAQIALEWASEAEPALPNGDWYCPTNDIFRARLIRLEQTLSSTLSEERTALLVSTAGEIGNNSFDHNLGNWPDTMGIFFAHDQGKRTIVLSDRGVGVLATLKRVIPSLSTHQEALRVAFTEIITGRAPEHRGNDLKYVRKAILAAASTLEFRTGNACLAISKKESTPTLGVAEPFLRGCLAIIKY